MKEILRTIISHTTIYNLSVKGGNKYVIKI